MSKNSDILENDILAFDAELLPILLIDRSKSKSTGKVSNIIWATDNYVPLGEGYAENDEISVEAISGDKGLILQPRVNKTKAEQEYRSRDKAEVFTPAWICNKQNNLIDAAWFGRTSPFNVENEDNTWTATTEKIPFPTLDGKTWQDYVRDTRMEVSCGEAPYLVSRYGVVTGVDIELKERIGLLDRKLRVICENVDEEKEWNSWVTVAYQNIYGFEWQGDNLLLAREALVYTYFDYYRHKFGKLPTKARTRKIAEIVAWNIWQMDGLKGVIPGSCHSKVQEDYDLFGGCTRTVMPCDGCQKDDITRHNGTYCIIMDWEERKEVRFIDLLKK